MSDQPHQNQPLQHTFSLGLGTQADKSGKGNGVKTSADVAKNRSEQLFGEANLESHQRKRTDYAESLRKNRA